MTRNKPRRGKPNDEPIPGIPGIPARIVSARLLLRPWQVADAARLKEAIDSNLAHLQEWMPWAMEEPSPIPEVEQRIGRMESGFDAGTDWAYGIFSADEQTVIGGCGLHPRVGPDALEIGYWVQKTHCRRGYATEAVAALTRAVFAHTPIERLEIRCDPRNVASAAIPRRLGYRHVRTIEQASTTPAGEPRDTMVWVLERGSPWRRELATGRDAR